MSTEQKYTFKDFKSDQEVRWCPGCGDTAILNSVQKAMAEIGHPKENYAVISGIGCSSRFPYYMNTYGFHSIHGRAGILASGVKAANPELSVWQITGDGDALAIGGNHFIHEIRRNLDLVIILFNNQIYGLTKGQYSPTSLFGQITKTSPFGTIEHPFHPGELVVGAQGKFFARSIDNKVNETAKILVEAEKHKGASVVEVLQNCVIFNDGAYNQITSSALRADNQLWLEHGKPMLFGKNKKKGLILDGMQLKVVNLETDNINESDILVHDAHEKNPLLHLALINMQIGDGFPVAFGIIRQVEAPTYEQLMEEQIKNVQAQAKIKCVDDLLHSGSTWEVK
ncbi:MAG: 2-oxoacid:ferredoxin oxidoreductase subunit beta [Bacteroidia bacterium]|nr:MAG: 2-oxoacid:ferredoxin oxidoreductase subunit beta [Bacteroidia bacterium]